MLLTITISLLIVTAVLVAVTGYVLYEHLEQNAAEFAVSVCLVIGGISIVISALALCGNSERAFEVFVVLITIIVMCLISLLSVYLHHRYEMRDYIQAKVDAGIKKYRADLEEYLKKEGL